MASAQWGQRVLQGMGKNRDLEHWDSRDVGHGKSWALGHWDCGGTGHHRSPGLWDMGHFTAWGQQGCRD